MAMLDSEKIIYEKAHEGISKFDYFVASGIGAMLAFMAHDRKPHKLALDSFNLELVALILLLVSFALSLRRIECANVALQTDLQVKVTTRELEAVRIHGTVTEFAVMKERLDSYRSLNEEVQKRAKKYYRWRDRLVIAGFSTFFVANVWQAYQLDPQFINTQATPTATNQVPIARISTAPAFAPATNGNAKLLKR